MIMKHLMLFIILLLKVYPTIGQNNYCFKLSVGGSIVIPKNAFAFKNSLGVIIFSNINQKIHLETGLLYESFNLNNYKNSIIYTSEWTNGSHKSYVNKTANINQSYIIVPLMLHIKTNKIVYGFGFNLAHLIHSATDQRVNGTYRNDDYANSEAVLTKSIKSVYEIDNNTLDNYRITNIYPCLTFGTNNKNKFTFNISAAYSLFGIRQYSNQIASFNSLSFALNSYIKIY